MTTPILPHYDGQHLTFFAATTATKCLIPCVWYGINAGFPSPAQDFVDTSIDLNQELIRNPSTTYFARVKGDSMQDAGIHDGDLLIIDKSLQPASGHIAVCCLDGEFTLKRLLIDASGCWLMPANARYQPIRVTEQNELSIWGIVVHVVKSL